MKYPRRVFLFILLGLFGLGIRPALAWGPLGHRIVADLATVQLNPEARTKVQRILTFEHASSLAGVAIWADTLRDNPSPAMEALGRHTRRMHYLRIHSSSCIYQARRDCPGGQCVVGAIAHYTQILGNSRLSMSKRAQALNFVVHFVADAHQPLHSGYRDDKGGNLYPVRFEGKDTNLHRLWDSALIRTRHRYARNYARLLETRSPLKVSLLKASVLQSATAWAEASCRIDRDDGVYPTGHRISRDYVVHMRPIAERQLRLAGAHLAELLNQTLGSR